MLTALGGPLMLQWASAHQASLFPSIPPSGQKAALQMGIGFRASKLIAAPFHSAALGPSLSDAHSESSLQPSLPKTTQTFPSMRPEEQLCYWFSDCCRVPFSHLLIRPLCLLPILHNSCAPSAWLVQWLCHFCCGLMQDLYSRLWPNLLDTLAQSCKSL